MLANVNYMELSEDKVNVKVSFCQKCGCVVRSAIEHKMDIKSKNEFAKEVLKYDLAVKTIPLLEYRKMDMSKWCSC